jgi:glutathione S-transferase
MSDFIGIREARKRKGLRLALLRGVPSPWGQAAKAIFEWKKIPFQRVQLLPDEPRELLREWTGQDSFPAAMFDDERPRTGWAEILFLAERLAPTPELIPADPGDRALMFGLAHEICGEMGLGWCRRLVLLGASMRAGSTEPLAAMGFKYGSSDAEQARANARCIEVLRLLSQQLARQQRAGKRHLVGSDLSAVDFYWATMCNLVVPLPPEQLALPDALRPAFTCSDPAVLGALSPELLAHRDFVYANHVKLPVEL